MSVGRLSLRTAGPVLGFVCDWLDDAYQQVIVEGALAGARDRGARLVCFVGGAPPLEGSPEPRESVFDLIGPESVDALIVLSGPLTNQAGPERLAALAERFRPLPMVSVAGHLLDGVPEVGVENAVGIERAVTHLVRDHGKTRLAFVGGPLANEEAAARLATFRAVLGSLSLAADDRMILTGDFASESGSAAVRELFDERRVSPREVDGVVAANDAMALGVLAELTKRSVRVPEDIAIIGFDDIDDTRYTSPPLSTVRQPLREQGREAVRLALAALRGENPSDLLLRTELVTRRSCGCFFHETGLPQAPLQDHSFEAALVDRRQILLAELARTARGRFGVLGAGWEARLVNAFAEQLRGRPRFFIETVDDTILRLADADVDFAILHDVISALRRELLSCIGRDIERRAFGGALFDEARRLAAEASERREARARLAGLRYGAELARFSANLAASFESDALGQVLPRLSRLGIGSAAVARYVEPTGPRGLAEIVARGESGPDRGVRAHPRELVRSIADGADGHYVGALFQDGRLHGFGMFELGVRAGFGYEALRELTSSALEGVRLRERVRELERDPSTPAPERGSGVPSGRPREPSGRPREPSARPREPSGPPRGPSGPPRGPSGPPREPK